MSTASRSIEETCVNIVPCRHGGHSSNNLFKAGHRVTIEDSICVNIVPRRHGGDTAVRDWVYRVGEELGYKESVAVFFVSEREIRRLNHQFRKKDVATDILSFAGVEEGVLGELVLCLAVVKRTGPEWLSTQEWLYYLILHGILHLLGFEHEGDKERAKKMYQVQDTIFEKLMGELSQKR